MTIVSLPIQHTTNPQIIFQPSLPSSLTLEELWNTVDFVPNLAQRDAILHTDGPLYLPAGPGSGKTRVLLWRTLNLLVFHGVQPDEIFLSTFTEKAALQLREGLEALLGIVTNRTGVPYDLNQMYVGTVHSLCQRLIADRRFAPERRRLTKPRLLDALGQYFHLYRSRTWHGLLNDVGLDVDVAGHGHINSYFGSSSQSKHEAVTNCLAFFNRLAEERIDPDAALDRLEENDPLIVGHCQRWGIDPNGLRTLFQLCIRYRASLEPNRRMPLTDFSLLQEHGFQVLQEAAHGGTVFRHVIVDEYQDTNPIQERIFFALAAGHGNFCVVGDDDQALYRFRGATVENFVQFPHRCLTQLGTGPRIIPLSTNYRSRSPIVDFYTDFMERRNWQRPGGGHYRVVDKNISAHRQEHHPAVVASTPAPPNDVCAEIALLVRDLLATGKVEDPNQIAFLFPSLQYQGKMVTQVERMKAALEEVGLRVYAPRAGRFLEVDEAMDVFGIYLQIFGCPARGAYGGAYRQFHDWLHDAQARGEVLLTEDPNLRAYVSSLRIEIDKAVRDYNLLTSLAERNRWDLDAPYHIDTMKRPLYMANGLAEKTKRSLESHWFEQLVRRRAEEGEPFTLGYVIRRATAIDYSVLDIFYKLCGFTHFRQMFDLAQDGTDEGPICNLGLITQYLARFIDEYVLIPTADMLGGEHLFRNLFFSSFLYALYRRGESEYEDSEDPFPRGRIPFLTIHQSKGLEFPVVVLGNTRKNDNEPQILEKMVRPFIDRPGSEPLEDMARFDVMRMFYVALSRAKNLLVLAHFRGRGQNINEPFKTMLDENFLRIPALDIATIPAERLADNDTARRYSFTGDYQAYKRCPRQYMIFRKYGFVPSRSETMFFGSVVHRTLEDLHNKLIAERQTAANGRLQQGGAA